MSLTFSYQSDIFKSLPDNSGYLAILISENRCDVAICSTAFVLAYLSRYENDGDKNQIDFLKDLFASNQPLFARRFQEVNIGFSHQDFSLVPSSLQFNSEDVLSIITNLENKKSFIGNTPLASAKLAYAIDYDIIQLIKQSFESYRTVHCLSFGIDMLLTTNSDALVVIDNGFFDLLVKKDNHLYSVNRHEFHNAEDVTYFTLLGLKDAGLDPNECHLALTGLVDKNDHVNQNLLSFILEAQVKHLERKIITRSDFDQATHYSSYVLNLLHANY